MSEQHSEGGEHMLMLAKRAAITRQSPLKQGARGRDRPLQGLPVVFWSAALARSWVDLPACGAAHWGLLSVADPFGSRQVLPFARQDTQAPGSKEVTGATIHSGT